ncbi:MULTISPECIES: HPP family protein [Roseobacteraceae]|uniref:HPP family protein n=1 Tax=Pseudosulfitobacter pseudonitzschiae TaxID=1402135 RepID=A0A221JYX0_9RHOB|nr:MULTISPECIES: HPP family protein [Roseobacteraceae]ASM71934.1 HPP family protein [Pseudosulfitobacter pseudonitzschiae]
MQIVARLMRALGPALPAVHPVEALRAGVGAFIGLAVVGMLVLSPVVDLQTGLYLIAPFGASAVLLFAVPNAPLAQPWSAVVGNTLAALIGVAVCMTVPEPAMRIALAVGLSIAVMILCRAVHPPAGAVAMTAAMNPEAVDRLGFWFALAPVALGTVALVVLAMIYARLTGRRYPFRHFEDRNAQGTTDPASIQRLGLSEAELTDLLERYRQSFNMGVEDLARLIGAAELQAAGHRTSPMIAADVMSRDLVTVAADTPVSEVADLFRRHKCTSLPVVGPEDRFLGVIFQMHLIDRARDDALRLNRGFGAAMARMLDRSRDRPAQAHEIMGVAGPRATPETPIAALLPLMAEGAVDAVPVLQRGRLRGIVTRTDLIAALAKLSLHQPDQHS